MSFIRQQPLTQKFRNTMEISIMWWNEMEKSKKIHPETNVIKNVALIDNEAIHIAYWGGRNKSGNLGDTRTPVQEESLYNKLIVLTVKYPSATVLGHSDFEASSGCPGFNVKEWLKQYEPEIAVA